MKTEKRISTYSEFWPFYVSQHSKAATRFIHFVGTTIGIFVVYLAIAKSSPTLLLLVPVAVYGMAWPSHFFIEKNKPATFKYPIWSLVSDLRMWALMATRQMHRHLGSNGVASTTESNFSRQ